MLPSVRLRNHTLSLSLGSLILLMLWGTGAAPAQPTARGWWSAELQPEAPIWYTDPPDESAIPYRLTPQPPLVFEAGAAAPAGAIHVHPDTTFQSVLGIGTSLEATTLYAIRKGSDPAAQQAILRALIDPVEGMGFNLFRITIGTSDFSDGRSVSDHPQGFYTYQDREDQPFSIQPDLDLGIVAMLRRAQEVAAVLDDADITPAWIDAALAELRF